MKREQTALAKEMGTLSKKDMQSLAKLRISRKEVFNPKDDHEGLTLFEAMTASISSIIGGGIVSLPFALQHTGIFVATGISIMIIFQ